MSWSEEQMSHSVWVFSVFLASLFLLGNWIPNLNPNLPVNTAIAASAQREPLNPSDRKEMEDLAVEFTNHYYTYNLENYVDEGKKLLPLLTEQYKEPYNKLLENGFLAANAVQAESKVVSTQILSVEKTAPNQGFIYLQFKANVSNNGKDTLNRYSTTLDLQKEAGKWRINGILSEQPVEFLNIRNLL
jgi:hypothetical protein